jgi:hypothetical protein
MWNAINADEIKKAKENVDPTLPLSEIRGVQGLKVTDEHLERGLEIFIPADERFKNGTIRFLLHDTQGPLGYSEVVPGGGGEIKVFCPAATSSKFKGTQSELWYYLDKHASSPEYTASTRKTYEMGTQR